MNRRMHFPFPGPEKDRTAETVLVPLPLGEPNDGGLDSRRIVAEFRRKLDNGGNTGQSHASAHIPGV